MKMFVLPVLFAATLPFLSQAPPANPEGPATTCVAIGGASVWGGFGYNHLVFLTNRCEATILCTVTTNIDPEPQEATVPINATVQVVTATNSPMRAFIPFVSCESVTR